VMVARGYRINYFDVWSSYFLFVRIYIGEFKLRYHSTPYKSTFGKMTVSSKSELSSSLLPSLQVPPEFARYNHIAEEKLVDHLEQWKHNADRVLDEIRNLVNQIGPNLSLQEQADVIFATAAFDGTGPWISSASQQSSRGTMELFSNIEQEPTCA